jgi:acyl dehydratase
VFYAEDFTVGRRFPTGEATVTVEAILAFARQWDPLPMHTDLKAAERGRFAGLIASGLHTISIATRLSVDAVVGDSAIVVGRGIQTIQLRKPVRPEARLRGSILVIEQRFVDAERAVIVWRNELIDQDDDLVLAMVVDCVIGRRPVGVPSYSD